MLTRIYKNSRNLHHSPQIGSRLSINQTIVQIQRPNLDTKFPTLIRVGITPLQWRTKSKVFSLARIIRADLPPIPIIHSLNLAIYQLPILAAIDE